jgi:hypothetical protein
MSCLALTLINMASDLECDSHRMAKKASRLSHATVLLALARFVYDKLSCMDYVSRV